jgi:hypothetical protein
LLNIIQQDSTSLGKLGASCSAILFAAGLFLSKAFWIILARSRFRPESEVSLSFGYQGEMPVKIDMAIRLPRVHEDGELPRVFLVEVDRVVELGKIDLEEP